ncbi:unnamed protein product, partial [Ectocarpus sp. 8 AP-2014]
RGRGGAGGAAVGERHGREVGAGRTSPADRRHIAHMEGMSSIEKAVSSSPLEDYQAIGQAAKKQAVLDAFLISLNVAAFVGYGTIPLDVFFPQRSLLTTWLPPGPTAWWGNFVGDVAWTIEPITVFLAPYLVLRRAQPSKTKTS